MKIAVIKFGARIVNSGTSGASGEAVSILKILSNIGEVHYFTKILPKDKPISYGIAHNIENELPDNSYDALVIINGNVNFFGGKEIPWVVNNFKAINKFNKPIFYFYCDVALPLKQAWKKITSFGYNKNDVIIDKDIYYIHQPYNIEKFKKRIEKDINVKDYFHFELYKFPLLNKSVNKDKIHDLGYGGTLRGGKREKMLIDWYFNYNKIKPEIFGPITPEKFKTDISNMINPIFTKPVQYYEFIDKMSTFRATINIADKEYCGNTLTQRIYEAVRANTVSFIPIEVDPEKRAFKNQELQNFLYINSKEEVEDRILYLRNEKNLKHIIDLQNKECNISEKEYVKPLKEYITKIINGR